MANESNSRFNPPEAPSPRLHTKFNKQSRPSDPPYHRTIILDGFKAKDLRELNLIYCCEQCSYFDSKKKTCAMGFKVEKHMRESQLRIYNLTGKMALCRSQEID